MTPRLKSTGLIWCILACFFIPSFAWDLSLKFKGKKYHTTDLSWHPDILEGYEARYVNQGDAFDGPCRSTIVRLKADSSSHRGFLYIHGFNDYFFQSEMGHRFVDSGYHFYAVDLRRYGRSRLPWQYPFNIREQKEYFADIDSAIVQMRKDGITDITLGGHSTGGLTVAFMAAELGDNIGVQRVVTDSPFLAWNFNSFYRNLLIPAVSDLGILFKNSKIKQSRCDGYAYSLLKQYDGEWTYNTDWKMIYSPPVTFSWIRAIQRSQKSTLKHASRIRVPLLVMHSSRKVDGCNWDSAFRYGDAVLDPFMLQRCGEEIKRKSQCPVHVCAIDSGLHDLILSLKPHRDAAYDTIFKFIRTYSL